MNKNDHFIHPFKSFEWFVLLLLKWHLGLQFWVRNCHCQGNISWSIISSMSTLDRHNSTPLSLSTFLILTFRNANLEFSQFLTVGTHIGTKPTDGGGRITYAIEFKHLNENGVTSCLYAAVLSLPCRSERSSNPSGMWKWLCRLRQPYWIRYSFESLNTKKINRMWRWRMVLLLLQRSCRYLPRWTLWFEWFKRGRDCWHCCWCSCCCCYRDIAITTVVCLKMKKKACFSE